MNLSSPQDGSLINSGDYLVEMEITRPVSSDVLKMALMGMGWSDLILDHEPKVLTPFCQKHDQCKADLELARVCQKEDGQADRAIVRFIGTLELPIYVQNTPYIRWSFCWRIRFDPFANMNLQLTLFPLETHRSYEVRFLARMKSEPTRVEVLKGLTSMGWETQKLSLLKKDMRLPGKPNASVTQWYGIVTWQAACSYITDQEPFFFEDVVAVADDEPISPNIIVASDESQIDLAQALPTQPAQQG